MYDDLMALLRTSYGWDVEPSAIPGRVGAREIGVESRDSIRGSAPRLRKRARRKSPGRS